jgi:uncharacterized surface protein with fasciclin (FAS1) repeats
MIFLTSVKHHKPQYIIQTLLPKHERNTKMNLNLTLCAIVIFNSLVANCYAFQSPAFSAKTRASTTLLRDTVSQVEEILSNQYPIFMKCIMSKDADCWKALSDASAEGFTIFAPNDDAMRALGDKKLSQLNDVRNEESAAKFATFHAIGEKVSADELYNSGGVVTIGGVIDVGRSRSGGFMGIGGKEDGGVTINGAKIVQTIEVDQSVIHEVDALVSPDLLWRYIDQLRIPGSN